MELSNLLTMDKDEARERVAAYREIKTPNDEDRRIIAIFTALASGKQVVDWKLAIRDAGRDENGLPVLALGRVRDQWCYLSQSGERTVFSAKNLNRLLVDDFVVDEWPKAKHVSMWDRWRSQVPMLPPEHRRWGRGQWLILWEVEEWAKAPAPPGDPILLRPLLGSLCTVEAVWDLTDVERLVLGQRPG